MKAASIITAILLGATTLPLSAAKPAQAKVSGVVIGATRAQVEKVFVNKVDANKGWEYRRTANDNSVLLGVYYNKLNNKVEAVSYESVDDKPFSDELIQKIVKANLPKGDWDNVEYGSPNHLYSDKSMQVEYYQVDTPKTIYGVEIGKKVKKLADGTLVGKTKILILPLAMEINMIRERRGW